MLTKFFKVSLLIIVISLLANIMAGCEKGNIMAENNDISIKTSIEAFFFNPENKKINITLQDKVDIDNLKIISFTGDEGNAGYAILENIETSKYKVNFVSGGFAGSNNIIELPILTSKKGKYLLGIIPRYNIRVKSVKIPLDDTEYIFELSDKPYTIQYKKVPDNTTATSALGSNISFYDATNKNITQDIQVISKK